MIRLVALIAVITRAYASVVILDTPKQEWSLKDLFLGLHKNDSSHFLTEEISHRYLFCNETEKSSASGKGLQCPAGMYCPEIFTASSTFTRTCLCKNDGTSGPIAICHASLTKLGHICYGLDESCQNYDRFSECRRWFLSEGVYVKKCTCRTGYTTGSVTETSNPVCMRIVNPAKTKDMYKAAMVALACFMVTAIGLIVLFLCNRSFLRNRQNRTTSSDPEDRRMSEVFNISESLAAMRLCDKPPTYDEVQRTDRMVNGVPPPEYNETSVPTRTRSQRLRRGDSAQQPSTSHLLGSTANSSTRTILPLQRIRRSNDESSPPEYSGPHIRALIPIGRVGILRNDLTTVVPSTPPDMANDEPAVVITSSEEVWTNAAARRADQNASSLTVQRLEPVGENPGVVNSAFVSEA